MRSLQVKKIKQKNVNWGKKLIENINFLFLMPLLYIVKLKILKTEATEMQATLAKL